MKKLIASIFITLFFANVNAATKYYLSGSGNDTINTGTSILSPWKTIAKLNTVNYVSGDSVFFKAGDVFRGTIYVNHSGVVFTSYGTGNKPIISGAEPVTNWTTLDINYYRANFSKPVTSFFVNNKEQTLARYPNEHRYLSYDSAQYSYLKDVSLTNPPIIPDSLKAGNVCMHTSQWSWEKAAITSVVGSKIDFSPSVTVKGLPKYGYFLYGNITHLDTIGEWYYGNSNHLLNYRSLTDPNLLSCEASVDSTGIQFAPGVSFITITNLAFEKQTKSGIAILYGNNRHIKIDNCYFAGQYNHGVNDKGKYNEIGNSYFRDVDGIAIYVNGSGANSTIHHNTFRNIGQFRNNGIGMQINLTVIKCAFVDSCYIHHNDIDSAGYCGIAADGGYHIIERNIIKNAMLMNNDGAALKSYGAASHHITYRNNFVSSSNGSTEGTFHPDFNTPGLYFDFNVNNCIVQENTIYDRTNKGIFLNSGTNHNTVIGNVVYGGNYGIDFHGTIAQTTPMTGMLVTHNSFFAKDPNAYIVTMADDTGIYNQGVIDSNYYFQPYNAVRYAFLDTSRTFADWQSITNFDLHSKSSFVNWALPTSYDTLFMNQTDNLLIISLGSTKYLDLDSIEVCGSITLQPYTSKILINTNTICSTAGMNKNTNENFISVFPNPCSSEVTIKTNNQSEKVIYKVINQLGQVVDSGFFTNGNAKISIANLPAGMYFIQTSGQETQTIKVLKN